jgi:regulator of RNase E activity RraB
LEGKGRAAYSISSADNVAHNSRTDFDQIDKLTTEQASLSLDQVWNDTLLVQRIIEGWSARNSPSDQSADKEHGKNDAPSVADDRAVLYELQRAGSDLTLFHHIRHYLYFPTETAARKAAETLRAEGYTVEVERGSDDVSWLALAAHSVIPSIEVITRVRSRLESLAASMRGEYDGWEAAVIK